MTEHCFFSTLTIQVINQSQHFTDIGGWGHRARTGKTRLVEPRLLVTIVPGKWRLKEE
jgi:hypothetical protein